MAFFHGGTTEPRGSRGNQQLITMHARMPSIAPMNYEHNYDIYVGYDTVAD